MQETSKQHTSHFYRNYKKRLKHNPYIETMQQENNPHCAAVPIFRKKTSSLSANTARGLQDRCNMPLTLQVSNIHSIQASTWLKGGKTSRVKDKVDKENPHLCA
jgi:hypothetical protein